MQKLKDIVGTDRDIFFKAMYGFDPEEWGGVNFSSIDNFLKKSRDKDLVAVYVTKNPPQTAGTPESYKGKIVGFYEISRRRLSLEDCISPAKQRQFAKDTASGKWGDCLKATRAWEITAADKSNVEDVLPATYTSTRAQSLSSCGVKLGDKEQATLLEMRVTERPVYCKQQPI